MARFVNRWFGAAGRRGHRFQPRLTALADRSLPSATLTGGTLSVVGTNVNIGWSGPDDIITIRRIGDNLFVDEQDGVLAPVARRGPFPVYGANPVTRISISANSGGDRINIESVQARLLS